MHLEGNESDAGQSLTDLPRLVKVASSSRSVVRDRARLHRVRPLRGLAPDTIVPDTPAKGVASNLSLLRENDHTGRRTDHAIPSMAS
jgi:hypothetical protein